MRRQPTSTPPLVIDARPRSVTGLLAGELVLGKSILRHTLEHAIGLAPRGNSVVILTDAHETAAVNGLLRELDRVRVRLTTDDPPPNAYILRTDRLYEFRKLKRAVAKRRDPESAVLWRLDREHAIRNAEDELTRRRSYQPLGRFWAFPIAKAIAASLVHSPIRPNGLTLAAGFLMLAAAALVACFPSTLALQVTIAAALALALVLDTADGHLARLQGTASPFGRWLDHILDELADVSLHGAIAWAAFAQSGHPAWLVLGILYVSGKYLFLVQSIAGDELDRSKSNITGGVSPSDMETTRVDDDGLQITPDFRSAARSVVRALGHADFRWHLWIVLAIAGRLDVALIVYAAYFPIRSGVRGFSRGVEHVCS